MKEGWHHYAIFHIKSTSVGTVCRNEMEVNVRKIKTNVGPSLLSVISIRVVKAASSAFCFVP